MFTSLTRSSISNGYGAASGGFIRRPRSDKWWRVGRGWKLRIEVVRTKIVVCMGATAAQSVLGKSVRVTKERGKFIELHSGPIAFITIHPSAIYRQREKDEQEKEYRRFVSEMKQVRRKLNSIKTVVSP